MNFLKLVYVIVGGILIGLAIYTLFLVLKIYLGIVDTEPAEIGYIWAYIGMIIPDLLIIFYSLSTLMGSQAEQLSK